MYMILYPSNNSMNGADGSYQCLYTEDMHRVAKALGDQDVQVYNLDNLTKIKDMKITFEEVPMELS